MYFLRIFTLEAEQDFVILELEFNRFFEDLKKRGKNVEIVSSNLIFINDIYILYVIYKST